MAEASGLTFRAKDPVICPVCEEKFYEERLRFGRGRTIAGNLTAELRRLYEPSQKYGLVYPLIYVPMVCPFCLYAAFPEDFAEAPDEAVANVRGSEEIRRAALDRLLPGLDFTQDRGLEEGIGAYFLSGHCYDGFPAEFSPSIKQGLAFLRAAWLCGDVHATKPRENFDRLQNVFYRKAWFFYLKAIESENDGTEGIGALPNPGPDIDKNFGYDGVLYLYGMLEYRHGPREDAEERTQALTRAKRIVARIFGMGRASKNKPAVLLDNARDLYDEINAELGVRNADPEADARAGH